MHALLDPLLRAHRDTEQLHAIAELVCPGEILGRDRGDALDIDRALVDLGAEGEARQDRELLRGIMALDVEGRIGLRVAEPLRLLEAFRKGQLLLLHAGEDVVAGAVENSIDACQRIPGKPLAQGLHDRNGAAHRGLEIERYAAFFGKRRQCDSVARKKRLVGSDHGLAGGERG